MSQDDHYPAERLEQFLLGALPAEQMRPIIGHLARGCERCRRLMAPMAVLLLGGEPAAPHPAPDAALDSALDSDLDSEYEAAISRSISRVRSLAGAGGARRGRRRSGVDLCRALLARSESLRHDDPRAMIRSAQLAGFVADNLPVDRHGTFAVADLQALSLAELANAERVADDLEAAQGLMIRALRRAELGSGDTALLARLLELAAAVVNERRRFDDALPLLDAAHALYAERGDSHRAGRALLAKGLYAGYSGRLEAGLGLLLEGLRRIAPEREPGLVVSGVHNLIWLLADDGRAADAARLLELARPIYQGALNVLRRRWLEGRIAAGRGEPAAAAAALAEVRAGFRRAALPYNEALVGLDLAAVRLQQGETEAAYGLLGEALATFAALGVEREQAAALLLLAEAVERRRVTTALLHSALETLGGRFLRPLPYSGGRPAAGEA